MSSKNKVVPYTSKEMFDANEEMMAAGRLVAQYRAAENARTQMLRESVKFGAMLMQWESYIGGNGAGRGHNGDGLKGWIEEHCPEINYKTATVYKALAVKAAKMLGGGAMAIAALQDEGKVIDPDGRTVTIDAEVIEKRDAIFEEATSRRKFEQQYFEFAAEASRGKAGRPVGTGHALVIERDAVKNAAALWFKPISIFSRGRASFLSAADVLPLERAKEAREELAELVRALDARIARG